MYQQIAIEMTANYYNNHIKNNNTKTPGTCNSRQWTGNNQQLITWFIRFDMKIYAHMHMHTCVWIIGVCMCVSAVIRQPTSSLDAANQLTSQQANNRCNNKIVVVVVNVIAICIVVVAVANCSNKLNRMQSPQAGCISFVVDWLCKNV